MAETSLLEGRRHVVKDCIGAVGVSLMGDDEMSLLGRRRARSSSCARSKYGLLMSIVIVVKR
jgi:hypothetical protein